MQMARVIDNQTNIWGRQNGPDPQRSDLWVIDFNLALFGLGRVLADANTMTPDITASVPSKLASYFASAVAMPELKIRPEVVRRDSRPYQMPGMDEPLDPIRILFLLDCFKPGGAFSTPYQSDIYRMLNAWRAVVRAGRGSMSSEFALALDDNFQIDYAFDVRVLFLRGSTKPTLSKGGAITANQAISSSVMNDLEISLQLRLVNCWLGSFKITELSYEGNKMAQIETTFYAEDIRQDAQTTG